MKSTEPARHDIFLQLVKWLGLSLMMGILIGLIIGYFKQILSLANQIRGNHPTLIYGLPFVTLLAGELLAETEIDRAQVYVPLLALFPFLYLLQGILVAFYGGSLLVAVIMTSISYVVTLFLFLNQSSWIYILIYLILTLAISAIFEYKHRHH